MAKEKILITVKTYPTLSSKYDEVVCTAGFKEDGSWVRIYPIPFRKMDDFEKYKKFQWIEVDLARNSKDSRKESHRTVSEISLLNIMGTENNWLERRRFVLEKAKVFTNLEELINLNKEGHLSLATFKPSRIIDFRVEESATREWDPEKLKIIEQRAKQNDLFEDNPKYFKVVEKLPYKFKYVFEDDEGKASTLMIEDWEIGALFLRQRKKYGGDEQRAIQDVRVKYLHDLVDNRDIHLFLGTTHRWDAKGLNPFVIVGVFSPPIILQQELF